MRKGSMEAEAPDEKVGKNGLRVLSAPPERKRIPSDEELKALIEELKRHQRKAAALLGETDDAPEAA